MNDLTVFCVYWGDKYDKGYVYALRDAVEVNLSVPHRFVCITTDYFKGIETRKPYAPYSGWWSKLNLFAPRMATGPSLYFDLDVVITGNLDYLVEYTEPKEYINHRYNITEVAYLAAPANWAQSGHGGIQSSVMAWGGNWTHPFDQFKSQWPDIRERLWGDQEYLWELLGDNWTRLPHVGSYKYHVSPAQAIPDDMAVCVFHGKPDPHEVTDPCILSYTSALRSYISTSTANGLQKASSATA